MTTHMTGTRKEWLAARLELLEAEKEQSLTVNPGGGMPPPSWDSEVTIHARP